MLKAINKGFSTQDIHDIYSKYPLSVVRLKEYIFKLDDLNSEVITKLNPDTKSTITDAIDFFIKEILENSARDLYDFFDKQDILCSVGVGLKSPTTVTVITGDKIYTDEFLSITGNNVITVPKKEDNTSIRVWYERHMFLFAFELLENKLNGN